MERTEGEPSSGTRRERTGEGAQPSRPEVLGPPAWSSGAPEPATGQIFAGRYELRGELGRGGQGAVFAAWDQRLKRSVAVKILRAGATASDAALGRFRREAEITMRLEHAGICPVFDVGRHDGAAFIVMRLIDGETLAERILSLRPPSKESGPARAAASTDVTAVEPDSDSDPPVARVDRATILDFVSIIERVARTLHVAHEASVVHRDIKPGNVMITRGGDTVVLDFGLARDDTADGGTLTQSGDILGTPAYMSPEQLRGPGAALDRRTDVYSLGVTLFECVALRKPFAAPTRDRLYHAILEDPPPNIRRCNPSTPRELKVVIEVALEKDRNRRYQTALDFAEDLRRVRESEPIRARPIGPGLRLRRWLARNPAIAWSAIIVFAALVIGLSVAVNLLRETNDALTAKERAIADFESLSDMKRVRDLRREADALWPAYPEVAPAMRAWLARADELRRRLPQHRTALDDLVHRGTPAIPTAPPPSPPSDGTAPAMQFGNTTDQWRYEYLSELVAAIATLVDDDPARGLMADVSARLAFAETVRQRTIIEPAAAWARAIESIASEKECPKYHGLRIAPQIGLLPFRRNENSGLWEFTLLQTGSAPSLDANDEPIVTEATGVVFVLLPGGHATLGPAPGEPSQTEDEWGHTVDTLPFFIAKHETSVGQWKRIIARDPLRTHAPVATSTEHDAPATNISWDECSDFARRLSCRLPTEDEWELACRAGTRTAYWFGDDPSDLQRRANVGDAAQARAAGARAEMMNLATWDDGFPEEAPVDAFVANPFGLFGLHGNVSEWCSDLWRAAPGVTSIGEGQPERLTPRRTVRDGNWVMPPSIARSSARLKYQQSTRSPAIGVRLARSIAPEGR